MNPFPAAELLMTIAFWVAVAITVGGGLLAVMTRRLIRSVCGLALASLGLALLFYFLHSPFLALMEILIYVGAVCVTIIFAVMLAEPDEPEEAKPRSAGTIFWGVTALLVSVAVWLSVVCLGTQHPWAPVTQPEKLGTLADVGVALLTTYSLAFEAISLVLLVAILGALAVARFGRTKP